MRDCDYAHSLLGASVALRAPVGKEGPFFISIEGVDGAGKSTVVRRLARMIDGVSIQTPSKSLAAKRIEIENIGNRAQKLDFYMESLRQQKREIVEFLSSRHVVCDRYIHSTIAYQWPDTPEVPRDIWREFTDILRPDFSFLLTVNQAARCLRISRRESETGNVIANDHDLVSIERAYSRFCRFGDLRAIDTSDMTPDEVCYEILKIIGVPR